MTRREKAMIEQHLSVNHCPSDYGYLDDPGFSWGAGGYRCDECWDREADNLELLYQALPKCNDIPTREIPEAVNATSKNKPNGMTSETFNKLLDELDGNSLETLKQKNAKYASPTDCLHNFDAGAEIMGWTPAQCAWGYMTKHLVALRDKVDKNDFGDRDDLLEKCQDIINYIRFIWLIGNETEAKKKGD